MLESLILINSNIVPMCQDGRFRMTKFVSNVSEVLNELKSAIKKKFVANLVLPQVILIPKQLLLFILSMVIYLVLKQSV